MICTTRYGLVAGVAVGLIVSAVVHAARVEYAGPDVMALVAREPSVGTSFNRAHVETRETAKGSQLAALTGYANDAIGACDSVNVIRFEPMTAHDFVGDTTTKLTGFGVYASFSDTSARGGHSLGVGESFIAPFVSLKISVQTTDGVKLDKDVLVSAKAIAEPDRFGRAEFLSMDAHAAQASVLSFAKPEIVRAIRELVRDKCAKSPL